MSNRALEQLAGIMHVSGYRDHADRLHRRCEAVPTQPSAPQEGLNALLRLAEVYAARGNFPEAIRLYRRVLRADEDANGIESPLLVPRLRALASLLDAAGESHEALCVRERISALVSNLEAV